MRPDLDVVELLERLEELLQRALSDGRLFLYARDLTRLLAWARTQPRRRVVLMGVLSSGAWLAAVLFATRGRPDSDDPLGDWPADSID
jgi:hypothetical protein